MTNFKYALVILSLVVALFLLPKAGFSYPITGDVIRADNTTIGAGITPDSWLYGIDVALDKISLALTFNPTDRARKGLDIARERLMEVRKMISENKLKAAQRAQQEYENDLNTVQSSVRQIRETNSTKEIKDEIKIEKDLEEHRSEIDEVRGELEVKMKVKGNVTQGQQRMINSIFGNLENKTSNVVIVIENEKNKTKIKIRQKTGKSDKEVEREVDELEEKEGLKKIREERASNKIEDAEEKLNETKELLTANITAFNSSAVESLLTQAETHLSNAKEAFNRSDYGMAFGQAVSAENLARNAERYLGKTPEAKENKIRAEVKGNETEVKVEVSGVKTRFSLGTGNKSEVISEIADKTGLTSSEVERIMKIKEENKTEEETSTSKDTHTKKVKS